MSETTGLLNCGARDRPIGILGRSGQVLPGLHSGPQQVHNIYSWWSWGRPCSPLVPRRNHTRTTVCPSYGLMRRRRYAATSFARAGGPRRAPEDQRQVAPSAVDAVPPRRRRLAVGRAFGRASLDEQHAARVERDCVPRWEGVGLRARCVLAKRREKGRAGSQREDGRGGALAELERRRPLAGLARVHVALVLVRWVAAEHGRELLEQLCAPRREWRRQPEQSGRVQIAHSGPALGASDLMLQQLRVHFRQPIVRDQPPFRCASSRRIDGKKRRLAIHDAGGNFRSLGHTGTE